MILSRTVLPWVSLEFLDVYAHCLPCMLTADAVASLPVLHPRHKLAYFKRMKWSERWINLAHDIVKKEYNTHYAGRFGKDVNTEESDEPEGQGDEGDEGDGSDDMVKLLLLLLLTTPTYNRCTGQFCEHFRAARKLQPTYRRRVE